MSETAVKRAKKWYIVHTYSGFEERVRQTLRQRADALGMGDSFGDIRIPTETIVEFKGGKKCEMQRKFLPGYILVEMAMNDDTWHVVKNTPKVTGFVGTGKTPTPLSDEEVNQILALRHPDSASLRRYLVDLGYMERNASVYRLRPRESWPTLETVAGATER